MYKPISAITVAYIKDVSLREISWFQEILTEVSWFQEILPCTKE